MGRDVAKTTLVVNITSILWAANISAVKDEAGVPIIPVHWRLWMPEWPCEYLSPSLAQFKDERLHRY